MRRSLFLSWPLPHLKRQCSKTRYFEWQKEKVLNSFLFPLVTCASLSFIRVSQLSWVLYVHEYLLTLHMSLPDTEVSLCMTSLKIFIEPTFGVTQQYPMWSYKHLLALSPPHSCHRYTGLSALHMSCLHLSHGQCIYFLPLEGSYPKPLHDWVSFSLVKLQLSQRGFPT